jgi:hypothetical protein
MDVAERARVIDFCLCLIFLLLNTAACVTAYFVFYHDDMLQHSHTNFLVYGFIQGFVGFIAGLYLARITPVATDTQEETVTLLEEENTCLEWNRRMPQ